MTADVEDVYELSPLQQGLLFHSLLAPRSGVYVEQVTFPVEGTLDVAAFEAAWQQVVAATGVLRTSRCTTWSGADSSCQWNDVRSTPVAATTCCHAASKAATSSVPSTGKVTCST